ncbi:MAG TPA: ABC transporter permease [Nitrolancea sp.]|nr:ABC transporter permease [Nitrolancea sp.]
MTTVEAQASASTLAVASARTRPPWWHRALRSRNLMIGVVIILLMLALGLLAPVLSSYDPLKPDYSVIIQPPSLSHPFGTDEFGRDVLTRVMYGARIDLRVGITAVLSPFIIGLILGALAAYFGGVVETIIMRILDIVQAFPFIVLIIAVVAILGPGLNNMYIAVALTAWVVYARLIRSEILVQKEQEYIIAAQAMGASNWRVMLRHLMPNTITSSIVYSMADIALYILLAASLSFLGLGAKPPTPEWGALITEGQAYMTTAWWMSTLPGVAIVITGIGLSLIGDGLSDLLRPAGR